LEHNPAPEGHVNYCFNAGADAYGNWHSSPWSGPFNPAFGGLQPASAATITDGLSNTAGASERVKEIGEHNSDMFDSLKPTATAAFGVSPAPNSNSTTPQVLYQLCLQNPPTPANMGSNAGDPAGGYWTDGNPAQELYNHVMPPDSWACAVLDNYDNQTGGDRHGREPAPGRGQRADDGRLGQEHQGHHQHDRLVGARDQERERGHRRQLLLIGPG
jgi:hypothetical protein